MKKLLFLFVFLLSSIGMSAQTFEVDGITYNVLTTSPDYTVEVTGYNADYEGGLVINGTVTYSNTEYKVVSIKGGQLFDVNTGIVTGSAFSNCSKAIYVGDLPYCTSIGLGAFHRCERLTSVGNLSACTSIGDFAFYCCYRLTSVGNLSASVSIGDYAFYYCYQLTSVDLSACTSIGDKAFYNCSNLTSIGDLSACTSIGDYAFNGCSLTSADLSACTSIGSNAFNRFEKVTISNNTPPTLTGVPSGEGTTFLVPTAALNAYRAAEYWSDIRFQVIAQEATHDYDVNAPILDGVGAGNLTNVMTLKVTGDINSEDIMFIRNNMVNLHHLDLTDANYVASTAEYASGKTTADNSVGGLYGLLRLRSVKLPKSAKSIEGDAFDGCSYLSDFTIPEGIERIEDGIYKIGVYQGAFTGCPITTITLPNSITYIGNNAFYNSISLTSIVLPESLTAIGNFAFTYCRSLASVTFSPNLATIGSQAFRDCWNLATLNLPTGLVTINGEAFRACSSLTELHIPASVESIGESAFAGCNNLKDVYTYVVDPININTNTFSTYTAATLYIPEQCENTYFRNAQWGQFIDKVTFNEPYTYFYANNDVLLQENDRFTPEVNEDIDFKGNAGSSITIEGSGDQALGDMDLYYDGTKWASAIANENLTANRVRFHIPVTGNRWRFFSFPFRVYLNKVTAPGSHVFRCYDGAQRAGNGTTGWKSLPNGTTYLEPGVGYIFQCNTTGDLVIEVDNPDFYWHGNDKTNTLTTYAPGTGISDQHASWNFIGNPMTNYYDIDDMHYTAPLTVWNGTSYVAYRPGDDNYQLQPFEAYFVQKPDDSSVPTYDKDKRMGHNAAVNLHNNKAAARRMNAGQRDRYLLNLVLSNGEQQDQTRVVFNEKKTANYERECDAAKFMSMEQVPQLYTIDQQVSYAINERQKGSVQVGFTAPKAGTYTLKAERMDMKMVLKDNVTGTTFELKNGEYTFESEAGTFNQRFLLMPAGEPTGIETATTTAETDSPAYRLDGRRAENGAKGVVVEKGKKVVK